MTANTTMTDTQFNALAQLLRLRPSPSQQAARLVFVGGMTQADASRKLGVSVGSVNNAAARVRSGLELAKKAVNARAESLE